MKFIYTCSKCGHSDSVDCMFEPLEDSESPYWICLSCGGNIRKKDTKVTSAL